MESHLYNKWFTFPKCILFFLTIKNVFRIVYNTNKIFPQMKLTFFLLGEDILMYNKLVGVI